MKKAKSSASSDPAPTENASSANDKVIDLDKEAAPPKAKAEEKDLWNDSCRPRARPRLGRRRQEIHFFVFEKITNEITNSK